MLKKYYKNFVLYNLILQYNYTDLKKIPKLKFININFGLKKKDIEKPETIIFFYFIILYITNQKPKIVRLKKNSLNLKLKKNSIIGCKVNLRNNNLYNFLYKLLFFFKIDFNKKNNLNCNFQIKKILNFPELRSEFIVLQNITSLNINMNINSLKGEELYIYLKNFNKI